MSWILLSTWSFGYAVVADTGKMYDDDDDDDTVWERATICIVHV